VALHADEWLIELARRDDPPTGPEELEPLLARLARAGVERLVPAACRNVLPLGDAAQATSIGALGPGLSFAESLEDEPAPVAAALVRLAEYLEQFDQLRRVRLAGIDMRLAQKTALELADPTSLARSLFDRVLETGLVVTYARPYLASNRAGVGNEWRPESTDDQALHDWIIDELRHPYHAHADRTSHRTLVDTTALLGIDGPPTLAESARPLTDSELAAIAELARKQAERLEARAQELGVPLGEERPAPAQYYGRRWRHQV
jgi:hypothetical protein